MRPKIRCDEESWKIWRFEGELNRPLDKVTQKAKSQIFNCNWPRKILYSIDEEGSYSRFVEFTGSQFVPYVSEEVIKFLLLMFRVP